MASNEGWTPTQRHIVVASYLGWMLDAFDFFLVVFVLKRIAGDFGTDVKSLTYAIFLTLAMRPVGAFLFGRLADHFGRRPALMASVLLYSAMELAPSDGELRYQLARDFELRHMIPEAIAIIRPEAYQVPHRGNESEGERRRREAREIRERQAGREHHETALEMLNRREAALDPHQQQRQHEAGH